MTQKTKCTSQGFYLKTEEVKYKGVYKLNDHVAVGCFWMLNCSGTNLVTENGSEGCSYHNQINCCQFQIVL